MEENPKAFDTGKQVRWHGILLGYRIKEKEGLTLVIPKRRYESKDEKTGKIRKSQWFKLFGGGWNINMEFLKHEEQIGVVKIMVKDETGKLYITTPEKWLRLGVPFTARDTEPQLSLKEKDFEIR